MPFRLPLTGLVAPTLASTARVQFASTARSAGVDMTWLILGRFPTSLAGSALLSRAPVVANQGSGLTMRMSTTTNGRLVITRGTDTFGSFTFVALDNAIVANQWRWYIAVIKGTNAWMASTSLDSARFGRLDVRSTGFTTLNAGLSGEDTAPFTTHMYYNSGSIVSNSGLGGVALCVAMPRACSQQEIQGIVRNPISAIPSATLWAMLTPSGFVENYALDGVTGHGGVIGTMSVVSVNATIPTSHREVSLPSSLASAMRASDALRAQASVSGSTLRVRMGG